MASQFWPEDGASGVLHHFTETLVAFEFSSGSGLQPHSIIFTGGLGDGLATTPYIADISRALQSTKWSLFSLTLTSSYQSWGLGHLDRDTDEIAACIRHVQKHKARKYGEPGKIVLMGHSTGSQCVLHYLYRPNPHQSMPEFDGGLHHLTRPALDGAIMQAPVSDREAVLWVLHEGFLGRQPSELRSLYDKLVGMATEAASQNGGSHDALLPLSLTSSLCYPSNTPISCRRFLSLVSPTSPESPSEDDLFSSDLTEERLAQTFGTVAERGLLRGKLMVLVSGADQSVPDWVDKEKLLSRWEKAADKNREKCIWDRQHSGVIPDASHALSNDDQDVPRKVLLQRVMSYLESLSRLANS